MPYRLCSGAHSHFDSGLDSPATCSAGPPAGVFRCAERAPQAAGNTVTGVGPPATSPVNPAFTMMPRGAGAGCVIAQAEHSVGRCNRPNLSQKDTMSRRTIARLLPRHLTPPVRQRQRTHARRRPGRRARNGAILAPLGQPRPGALTLAQSVQHGMHRDVPSPFPWRADSKRRDCQAGPRKKASRCKGMPGPLPRRAHVLKR